MLFDNPLPGTESNAQKYPCVIFLEDFATGSIAEYFCDKNVKTESMLADDVLSCSIVPAKTHMQHSILI